MRISVDIFWGTTTGKGRIRPMGVWLLQEPINTLKWRLVFIDHYNTAWMLKGALAEGEKYEIF